MEMKPVFESSARGSSRMTDLEVAMAETAGLLPTDDDTNMKRSPSGKRTNALRAEFFSRMSGGGGASGWRRTRSLLCRSEQQTCAWKKWGLGALVFLFLGYLNFLAFPWLMLHYGNNYREPIRATVPTSRIEKWGWASYHKTLKAKAKKVGADVNVLLLGDSITEEMLDTGLGSKRDWGAPHEEQMRTWKEYYEPLGALNLGVAGDQTQHLLWRLQNGELPSVLKPQTIMVAIGTNNLGNGQTSCDTVAGIRAVVEYVLEARPKALIVLVGLFPRAEVYYEDSNKPWDIIFEVNESVRKVAEKEWGDRVRYVNCNARFLTTDDEDKIVLNPETIKDDNLHLTPAGLEAWAQCVAGDIKAGLHS